MTDQGHIKAWRVAIVGSPDYPDANRKVYQRLKDLKQDWPKASFHVITGCTGNVAAAALRAAKKLRMSYSSLEHGIVDEAERVICFWDFLDADTAKLITDSVGRELHTEIWDKAVDEETGRPLPAGARAVEHLGVSP